MAQRLLIFSNSRHCDPVQKGAQSSCFLINVASAKDNMINKINSRFDSLWYQTQLAQSDIP